MKKIVIQNITYELLDDVKDAFDKDLVTDYITDYFYPFTYIVGDYSYGKLRLKGFYDKNDNNCSKINNIDNLNSYLENNCAYGCRWFRLKKISKDDK